jgi:hypothetical protein
MVVMFSYTALEQLSGQKPPSANQRTQRVEYKDDHTR